MQTEQETSIQQCKENNKKLVKLNVQNILNQNPLIEISIF